MVMVAAAAAADDRRKRAVLRLAMAGIAALVLSSSILSRNGSSTGGGDGDGDGVDGRPSLEEMQYEGEIHRLLEAISDAEGDYGELIMPDWLAQLDDDHAAAAAGDDDDSTYLESAMGAAVAAESAVPYPQPDLVPYTLLDVIDASHRLQNVYGAMVYDPESDDFLFLYPGGQGWVSGCIKAVSSFVAFAYILRTKFPDRFQGPGSPEFAVGFTAGDYAHLRVHCLADFPHVTDDCLATDAPVLMFGSVFRHAEIFPNMIAMPMPEKHNLRCFKDYVNWGGVCGPLSKELIFGEPLGLTYEDLIPQVVWRGTDFGYLNHITVGKQRMPVWDIDVPEEVVALEDEAEKKIAMARSMREAYPNLYPRWQGVILTAEAEREAEEEWQAKGGDRPLPWANIKFTGPSGAAKRPQEYDKFEEYGISAIGGRLGLEDLAGYKYHIDIGGGGGTTWSGTIQKLAMPGLLFHHVTPTKDYIHDYMKPWIHYVPVASDLSDLKEKFEWAESHPEAAKMIADQGTALIRNIGTLEGFSEMFEQVFMEPMQRIMEAYQPVSPDTPWRDVVKNAPGLPTKLKYRCPGKTPGKGDCTPGGTL